MPSSGLNMRHGMKKLRSRQRGLYHTRGFADEPGLRGNVHNSKILGPKFRAKLKIWSKCDDGDRLQNLLTGWLAHERTEIES
jgi:hypothetical protein